MCNGGGFDRHATLVTAMAEALGVDIDATIDSGAMLPEEFDIQVFNCMGCSRPDACEVWIAAQDGVARRAPDYCRNKESLEALTES